MRPIIFLALAALLWTTMGNCSGEALAGKFNRRLSVGDVAPAWSELAGTDDRRWSLHDFREARFVVVLFLGNSCPVVKSHEPGLSRIARDFHDRGVHFVAINVGSSPADSLDAMKRRAVDGGYTFPYLFDEGRSVGKEYGVTATPQVFLLDGARRIRYMGAIDDHPDARQAERMYLRDAITSLLEGVPPRPDETRPLGCAVEYDAAR